MPMTPPDPARYADGSLDPTTRRALDPAPPTRAEWKRVSDHIALRVLPCARPAGQRGRRIAAALALAACAVFAILVWEGRKAPAPSNPTPELAAAQPRPDPLAEFAVLPVASDDEMRIATLRGDWGTGLVVGLHPLEGELQLATAGEVTVGRAPVGMATPPDFDDEPMVLGFLGARASE